MQLTKDEIGAADELFQWQFEEWLSKTCPSGDVESVQRQWEESRSYRLIVEQLAAVIAAHTAKVLVDVKPVAWGIFARNGNIRFWACDKASADSQAAKIGGEVVGIYPATTVAALKSERDALQARVDAVEKDAGLRSDVAIPFKLYAKELPDAKNFGTEYGPHYSSEWCVVVAPSGSVRTEKFTVSAATEDRRLLNNWHRPGWPPKYIAWAYVSDVVAAIDAALAAKGQA